MQFTLTDGSQANINMHTHNPKLNVDRGVWLRENHSCSKWDGWYVWSCNCTPGILPMFVLLLCIWQPASTPAETHKFHNKMWPHLQAALLTFSPENLTSRKSYPLGITLNMMKRIYFDYYRYWGRWIAVILMAWRSSISSMGVTHLSDTHIGILSILGFSFFFFFLLLGMAFSFHQRERFAPDLH